VQSLPCSWLASTFQSVSFSEIGKIDFTKYSGTSIIRTSIIQNVNYPNFKLTALLEYFVKSVCFIRVVVQSSVYKCMDGRLYILFNYMNTSPPY